MKRLGGFLILIFCAQLAKSQFTDSIQSYINMDTSLVIKEVFSNPESYRLKIILSQIISDKEGNKQISSWRFRDTVSEYAYPASMVKIPMAFSFMQFLNENRQFSNNLSDVLIDSSSYIKERSLHDDLLFMLSASDNNAFNRLYNLIGCKYLNNNLQRKGYSNSIIVHRFEQGNEKYHQSALPVKIFSRTCDSIYSHPLDSAKNILEHGLKDSLVGIGYYMSDSVISTPKSFRFHNYVDIRDVHDMMVSLFYPEFSNHKPYNITTAQRDTIVKFLQHSPLNPNSVEYADTSIFHPNFLRLILFGRDKNVSYPEIEFCNKSAMAYGFMADCCHLRDTTNSVEFFLTIYIYLNRDEILNDNSYEFDSVGLPFMRRFGELIYEKLKTVK